jgi:unsaturated rhamnogalacturonyl hydrolase
MSASATVVAVAQSLLDLEYETWNFGDSVGFEGLVRASDLTGDDTYAQFARAWMRSWATRRRPFRRLDATAPGTAMVQILRRYGDEDLLGAARDLADYLVSRPTIRGVFATWNSSPLMAPYGGEQLSAEEQLWLDNPPAGSFLDCLHFDPPFLTGLGALTDDADLVRIGVTQARAYVRELQLPSGDFAHFFLEGVDGVFGIGWTRGQGWALLGLLDVLENLRKPDVTTPPDDDDLRVLESAVVRLADRMIASQRADGHWDARLDDPSSGMESSTAAFMAEGFRRARELGISTASSLIAAERRARAAVLSSIDARGLLAEVSVAVMACTRDSHYANVPRGYRVPWGQGPALLALTEGDSHER